MNYLGCLNTNFMKSALLFLLICFSSMHLFSQSTSEIHWTWSNTYSNQSNSIANRIAVDDSLNIYVAGYFRDTLVVDWATLYGPSNNDRAFIGKFDPNGNLLWIRTIDWGSFVNSITLNSENDVMLLCNFGIIIVYDGITGTPITYYNIPDAITDSNGTGFEYIDKMELDTADNMYLLSTVCDNNIWVDSCKVTVYETQGGAITNTLWKKSFEVGFNGFPFYGLNMAIDSSNNVYVGGKTEFSYHLSLSGTDINSLSVPGEPATNFIAKYNSQGDAQWLDTIQTWSDLVTMDLKVSDATNSLYTTGYHFLDQHIHGDTLFVDTTNQTQIFVSRYDLNGNYQWAKAYPLASKTLKSFTGASWGALGNELQLSDSGYVYLRGSFTGSIIFNNDTLVEDTTVVLPNYVADDVFIAKLDGNGDALWGKYVGNMGGDGSQNGAFWVDPELDVLYLVGYYADTNNLNKLQTPTDPIKGIFIGKEGGASTVGLNEIESEDFSLLVVPNPSNGHVNIYKSAETPILPYSLCTSDGRVVASGKLISDKEQLNFEEYESGIYLLITEFGTVKLIKE